MRPSEKSYAAAVCLSAIFGVLGIHHFYLGRWGHGLLDLTMTFSGILLIAAGSFVMGILILAVDVIHTFVITILLLIGAYKDGSGRVVAYPGQFQT